MLTPRRWRFAAVAWLALAPLLLASCRGTRPGPASAGTVDRAVTTGTAVTAGVRKAVLPNGLRVLAVERHGVPVVACVIAYHVGSVDEPVGKSGMAHFLEHVMFKGTDRYAKGEIDLLTMKNGGSNNAWTNEDLTVYHFTFASDRWESALEIEANRMRNCRFDPKEVEAEKQVVIEELKSTLDSPWQNLAIEAGKELYRGHPYARPVIGLEPEILAMTPEDLRAFYNKYYVPNNAVLVLVGDFQADGVLRAVGERFGSIPAGAPLEPRPSPARPRQDAERRTELTHGTVVDRLLVGFATVPVCDPEDPVLDVISTVLGEGRSCRLYRRLVEDEQLASAVECTNDARQYPGAFTVGVEAVPTADRARVEELVHEELARLARGAVTEAELRRAKNRIAADFTFARATSLGFAEELAYYEALRDHTYLDSYLARVEAVTAEDVQALAARRFVPPNRTVAWSLADREAPEEDASAPPPPPPATRSAPRFELGETWQVRLDNGLTVLVYRKADLPMVTLRAHVEADSLTVPAELCGLAELTGTMLLEGTPTRDSHRIAEQVEDVGGTLVAAEDGLGLRVLSRDLEFGLELVADLLQNPVFPDERLERQRGLALARLAAEEDEPDTVARKLFLRSIYGDHPLGRPASGDVASMKRITRRDLVAHHGTYYRPNNTVLAIVGDVEPADVLARVRKNFGSWAGAPVRLPVPAAPAEGVASAPSYVTMPLEQVTVLLGHIGIRRTDRDYVSLQVMDYVLGKGTGFTDRISRSLRDEQGLAYQVYAEITGSAGKEPGVFEAYLATRPQNLDAALAGLEQEVRRLIAEPPTPEEVRNAQDYLIGNFVFRFETADQFAEYLILVTRFGLGLDYLARYPEAIAAVTPEEVHRVARAWLHPDRWVRVVVGPIDEQGRPLEFENEEAAEESASEPGK